MITVEELRGALARGYTHPKNAHKVLDPDLLDAIFDEVAKLLLRTEIEEVIKGYTDKEMNSELIESMSADILKWLMSRDLLVSMKK